MCRYTNISLRCLDHYHKNIDGKTTRQFQICKSHTGQSFPIPSAIYLYVSMNAIITYFVSPELRVRP